jgi:hypothetical protein
MLWPLILMKHSSGCFVYGYDFCDALWLLRNLLDIARLVSYYYGYKVINKIIQSPLRCRHEKELREIEELVFSIDRTSFTHISATEE